MLKIAKKYEQKLNEKVMDSVMDPKYKFWQLEYPDTVVKVDDSFWGQIQLVSVKDEEVIGYLRAKWDRPENYIGNISCVHFGEDHKNTFAADIIKFWKYLVYKLKVPKIKWSVVNSNPAKVFYDRIIENYGGRIVGYESYAVLIEGKYYDMTYYEWINSYFECMCCGYRTRSEEEVVCWKCGLGEMVYVNPFH